MPLTTETFIKQHKKKIEIITNDKALIAIFVTHSIKHENYFLIISIHYFIFFLSSFTLIFQNDYI